MQRAGRHADTTALARALVGLGVPAPHTGEPLLLGAGDAFRADYADILAEIDCRHLMTDD